jgi:hypothetical protein
MCPVVVDGAKETEMEKNINAHTHKKKKISATIGQTKKQT